MGTTNTSPVRLLAVGDIYFNRESNASPYNELDGMLAAADLRFCNYEAPISSNTRSLPGRQWALNTPPSNLAALKAGNFNVLSLANNHILDFGFDALEQTLQALDKEGASYTGAGRNLTDALKPVVLEQSGQRFGFLALAGAFPPAYAASAAQAGLAPIRVKTAYTPNPIRDAEHPGSPPLISTSVDPNDISILENAIASLKASVDHVIVSFHWGVPGQRELVDYQRQVAHVSIDAGASLILGHHAHVLQAVELYGRGIIFYGLSHFIFDLPGIISQLGFDTETAAVSVDFSRDEVLGASITPIVMEEGTGPRHADEVEGKRILGILTDTSKPVGTRFSMDSASGQIRVRL